MSLPIIPCEGGCKCPTRHRFVCKVPETIEETQKYFNNTKRLKKYEVELLVYEFTECKVDRIYGYEVAPKKGKRILAN